MKRQFDDLNEIETDTIDYEEYFGEMDLPEEEKQRRIKLAEQFEVLFLFFFSAFLKDREKDYQNMLHTKYVETAMAFLGMKQTPAYINGYAEQISKDIIRVTKENGDSEYYTSQKRAKFISANEANTIGNYGQEIEAIRAGKKYKTWKTMKDNKVRHTHVEVDEKRIGIFEPFEVGDSLMMFPLDGETFGADAKEIVNCRCVVKYS